MIKKIKNDMALIFWHKNQPFTFSDKREQQSWVDMSSLIKISETQVMKHKPHGQGLRKDYAVGDLVQWNRWHLNTDPFTTGPWDSTHTVKSHMGIITKVYQSATRCWTAEVKFIPSVLDHWGDQSNIVPLGCLIKLS